MSLNLDGNELGEEGAEVLAASLVRNRGLKYLELKDNIIGDAGAKALAQGLSGQTDMVLLDLTSNEIGIEGAKAIAHYLIGRQEDYPVWSERARRIYSIPHSLLTICRLPACLPACLPVGPIAHRGQLLHARDADFEQQQHLGRGLDCARKGAARQHDVALVAVAQVWYPH